MRRFWLLRQLTVTVLRLSTPHLLRASETEPSHTLPCMRLRTTLCVSGWGAVPFRSLRACQGGQRQPVVSNDEPQQEGE